MTTGKFISFMAVTTGTLYFSIGFIIGVKKKFWTFRRLRFFTFVGSILFGIIVGNIFFFMQAWPVALRIAGGSTSFFIAIAVFNLFSKQTIKMMTKEPLKTKYHVKEDEGKSRFKWLFRFY